MSVDWRKAPSGATHSKGDYFYKRDMFGGWSLWDGLRWQQYLVDDKEVALGMVVRPWDGESLPLVGTACEFQGYEAGVKVWMQATVIGHDGDIVVLGYKGNYFGESLSDLRPIRTPEQIAEEERKAAIDGMINAVCTANPQCITIAQARITCTSLYEAGYRKVEGGAE